MKHLKILRILDLVLGTITVATGLAVLLLAITPVGLSALPGVSGSEQLTLWATGGLAGALGLLMLTEGALLFLAAQRVLHGRGRLLQSLVAVLNLGSIPTGLLFGLYALWVCWVNPESRASFEGR
ncbi:MAG: hypothetical protein JXX28_04415 [Deltaproteobacteria bacterium]|nr:hypothetical protein [Deltaproteobacteria bacterium]